MSVDRTLAAIDAALEPWECDEDAAAWHADGGPDELADEEGMRGRSPSWVIHDEVHLLFRPVPIPVPEFWASMVSMQEWGASLGRALRPAFSVLDDTAKMIAQAYGFCWSGGELHYHGEDAPRRVVRRCRTCYPQGFTSRLAVDGGEYRRRQRARRRRR